MPLNPIAYTGCVIGWIHVTDGSGFVDERGIEDVALPLTAEPAASRCLHLDTLTT
jgi:hypothetical protein